MVITISKSFSFINILTFIHEVIFRVLLVVTLLKDKISSLLITSIVVNRFAPFGNFQVTALV